MTKEEFLDGFLKYRHGFDIRCDTLEQRHQAIDILRAYLPMDAADTTCAADTYSAEVWPFLFYRKPYGFALHALRDRAIPFETFLEIMEEESAEESITFGAALEDLL